MSLSRGETRRTYLQDEHALLTRLGHVGLEGSETGTDVSEGPSSTRTPGNGAPMLSDGGSGSGIAKPWAVKWCAFAVGLALAIAQTRQWGDPRAGARLALFYLLDALGNLTLWPHWVSRFDAGRTIKIESSMLYTAGCSVEGLIRV